MRIPKKIKSLIPSSCDKYFLRCGRVNYAFDIGDEQSMSDTACVAFRNGVLQNDITLLHPSAFITPEEMEDDAKFEARCQTSFNRREIIYFVCADAAGDYWIGFAYSRSAFVKQVRNMECVQVWPFCAVPYPYLAERNTFRNMVETLPEDRVVFSDAGYSTSGAIFVTDEANIVYTLEGYHGIASPETLQSAIRRGAFFTSENNVPVDDFLDLPPWELARRYPGVAMVIGIDTYTSVYRNKNQRMYCLFEYGPDRYAEAINHVSTMIMTANYEFVFLLSNSTQAGYEETQKNNALPGKFMLSRRSFPAPEVFTGIAGTSLLSAVQAVLQANKVPSYAVQLWHNDGPKRTSEEVFFSRADNEWGVSATEKNQSSSPHFLSTQLCPSAITSLLERHGKSVMVFRGIKKFFKGNKPIRPIPLAEAFSIALFVMSVFDWRFSGYSYDDIRKEATFLMCFMASVGLVSLSDLAATKFCCDANGKLFCPELTDTGLPLTKDEITEENAQNIVLAITLYGAAIIDPEITSIETEMSTLWNKTAGYISLMCKNKENVPVTGLFNFIISHHSLVGATFY